MTAGYRTQLCRLLRRHRVAEEAAAPNLRPGQMFEQKRLAQRRVELDVKMKTAVIAAVGMLASIAAVSGALRTPLLPALKAER